jgi:hypothetical protein
VNRPPSIRQNEIVVDIEQRAVSGVSMVISLCSRLTGYIASNDKTPVTDGHIDLYEGGSKAKSALVGRVFVQVKGRSTANPVNPKKQTIKFGIDKDDLKFFSRNGGGLYFYVPMRSNGTEEEVFYAILSPFRINRLTGRKSKDKNSISFDFKRFPSEPVDIERIVSLANKQRSQSFSPGGDASLLKTARSFTIHTLSGLDQARPTQFNLDHDDFAILVTTSEGLEVPIDIDIAFYPDDYIPQKVEMRIKSGSTLFDHPTRERISDEELLLRCSDGLSVRIINRGDEVVSKVDLTLSGGLRAQLRDVNFFLDMATGGPLVIGDFESTPQPQPFDDIEQLRATQRALGGMAELFDYFALDDEFVDSLTWTLDEKRSLLRLRDGLVRKSEIAATGDGVGRWDFPIGSDKVILLVTAGSAAGHKSISDPFDPDSRARLRIFGTSEDEIVEEIDWATVYESLEIEDFLSALNLHLDKIAVAYDSLPDTKIRYQLANAVFLKITLAADLSHGARRKYLLRGAETLADWLVANTDNDIVHRINRWQTIARHRPLTAPEKGGIVAARRVLASTDLVLEACLAILLADDLTLEQVLAEMSPDDRAGLKSWPIWNLASGTFGERTYV